MAKLLSMLFALVFGFVAQAQAAIELPETLSVTDYETFVGTVLVALAVIWTGRKLIKLVNRS